MARLLVLFVTAFVDMVGLAIVLPLLPYYASDLGAGATTVGILISAFSVAQLLSAPAWGRISDRYGRRPVIVGGLLITAAAYLLFAVSSSVWLLMLSRFVQGIGGGTIGVVQAYVVDVSPAKHRTRSLGWLSAVTSLGAVVGPAFGSVLATVGGKSAPGLAAALLALGVAGFAWRFLHEAATDRVTSEHRTIQSRTALGAIAHVATRWREPAPRLIWVYAVGIGAFYGTVPIMPLLLEARLEIAADSVGYVIMYLGGMGVLLRSIVLGPAVDRFGDERLARFGIVFLACGLTMMSVVRSVPTLVGALTLMPLGTAFIFPAVSAMLSRGVSPTERGLIMGVQHTFGGVSRVLFPVGVGLAMDHFGMGVPFLVAACLVLATLPLMCRVFPVTPHETEHAFATSPVTGDAS